MKLDIDGQQEWFDCTVSPLGMPDSDVRVIEASPELVERFRGTPTAIHHVRALVGQAVSQGGVHSPSSAIAFGAPYRREPA
ncbi:MAG: hypothetical protein GXP62_20765 [Oligoflexia bacterium]|nr:hypothetical protein [Oligoflexia bacterium]